MLENGQNTLSAFVSSIHLGQGPKAGQSNFGRVAYGKGYQATKLAKTLPKRIASERSLTFQRALNAVKLLIKSSSCQSNLVVVVSVKTSLPFINLMVSNLSNMK